MFIVHRYVAEGYLKVKNGIGDPNSIYGQAVCFPSR